jgi:hypothetical protein
MGYPVGTYTDTWEWENSQYELLGGGFMPEEGCGTPPIGCFLQITGSSHVDVTVRGDDDGSIFIGTSGATGNTTFYLNGVVKYSGANTSYIFTGLTAGVYDVAVEDSHNPPCYVTLNNVTILDGEFRTGDFQIISPTGLTAVENPIIIDVATKINNPMPTPSITTITVSGGTISDGFSLIFNLTSPYAYTQTFYAKAYPSKPNYFLASTLNNQYGVPVGSNSLTEICTSLAEALQQDSLIPKIYYINNSGTVVTLQAKETGSRFNLNTTNVIAQTGAIKVAQTQTGTDYCDGQITDNYSISCEIMANVDFTNQYPMTGTTGDFNRIAEMILPFNPSNIHRFDISSILKSQVSTPIPNLLMTGSTMLPVMQPYFCKISEMYPLVANTNTVKKRYKTTTGVQWVINSSLDRYAKNDMQEYIDVPVKFLTNSPSPKQIQRSSNEFLYFVLPRDYGTDLDCRGDMYFYDGTQVTGVTFFEISTGTTNAGGCMILNLSYSKLGLGSYEVSGTTNRKIKRLELAIYASGGTTQYTESKTYRFEIDEMPRKFGVIFQNALGMYDSFDFIGVVEESVKRDFDNYTIPINYNADGSMTAGQRNVATYNTKVTKRLVANTGWIDETHFDWLMELMKSNNIYSTSSANQNYLNMVEYSYKKSSLDDLFDIEVTFDWTIYENTMTV